MAELTPLHVLLKVMTTLWERGELDRAAAVARTAAPYLHGKAPPGRVGDVFGGDLAGVSDDELKKFGRDGEGIGGVAATKADPDAVG